VRSSSDRQEFLHPAAPGSEQDGLGPVDGAQLRVGVVDVCPDRARGNPNFVRDLLVDLALGEASEDLELSARKGTRIDIALPPEPVRGTS